MGAAQASGGQAKKIAVVLFNLGGPDRPEAVEPFLFNLFSDPYIIELGNPLRWLVAKWVAKRRAPIARAIYAEIGGGSPLLALTEDQARALAARLGSGTEVFVAMRYWHPLSAETAAAVKAFGPDEIVLVPLYPQFSRSTTGSSVRVWHEAAEAVGLTVKTSMICCYPTEPGLIAAEAALVRAGLDEAAKAGRPRVLFSAHGLPKRMVEKGDPYRWQVERTAGAIVEALDLEGLDWVVCYQSRVGRMEWIGPSTDAELARAGADGVPVVVVPIAFVSEHSETLVELDIEYRKLAEEKGVPAYVRVAAVGTHENFIAGLVRLVERARAAASGLDSGTGGRLCPAAFGRCPFGGAA